MQNVTANFRFFSESSGGEAANVLVRKLDWNADLFSHPESPSHRHGPYDFSTDEIALLRRDLKVIIAADGLCPYACLDVELMSF